MAEPYFIGGEDLLDDSTLAEGVLGKGDGKRSTKTLIANEEVATALALLEDYVWMLIRRFQIMHERQYGERLEPEQVVDTYDGVARYAKAHRSLLEHYGSVKGFTLKVAFGHHEDERDRYDRNSASIGVDDADRRRFLQRKKGGSGPEWN